MKGKGLYDHLRWCVINGKGPFKNEYYENLDSYTATDWIVAFGAREHILYLLNKNKEDEGSKEWSSICKKEITSVFVAMVENLIPVRRAPHAPAFDGGPLLFNYEAEYEVAGYDSSSIKPINLGNIQDMLEFTAEENPETIASWLSEVSASGLTEKHFWRDIDKRLAMAMSLDLYPSHGINNPSFICINLDHDNRTLIQHFEQWLYMARQSKQRKPTIARSEEIIKRTTKWKEYKLLQYLDLVLMAKYQNINLSKTKLRKMAASLLHPGQYEEDNIKKHIHQWLHPFVSDGLKEIT